MTTVADKLACAQRELSMRKRVYPRWVEQGYMSQTKASYEIRMMEEIVKDYTELESKERLL